MIEEVIIDMSMPCLKELNLRNNKIRDIVIGEGIEFPQLHKLYLSNNNLASLDFLPEKETITIFPALNELSIENNYLNMTSDEIALLLFTKLKDYIPSLVHKVKAALSMQREIQEEPLSG
jgi:hypothetical protein